MTEQSITKEPKWVTVARKYLGVKEHPGPADAPQVIAFFAEAGHPEVKHDSVPWCAAFVGAVLHESGVKPSGTLWALDYAKWGQHLDRPYVGAIGTKKRTGGGHVFFVIGYDSNYVWALGGNQGDSVSIEKIHRTQVFSYSWPPLEPVPKDRPAVVVPGKAPTGVSEE
jgi:uncharacterized protein (TIGR02594 family)